MTAPRVVVAVCALTCAVMASPAAQTANPKGVPKVLNNRLVVGDPVWREMPVRPDLQRQYDKVWQTALNTILEHGFDIATMERDSGYLRTAPNEKIVRLQTNWYYRIQVSVKLVITPADPATKTEMTVSKVRIQVAGEVTNIDPKRGLKAQFIGYDSVMLQTLFQDLQAKLGNV